MKIKTTMKSLRKANLALLGMTFRTVRNKIVKPSLTPSALAKNTRTGVSQICVFFSYRNFFKIEELDMSVDKWANAFIDASTPGSLIFPMSIGKQIRSFGIDLAITHPAVLSMEHEWIKRTHLRPQLHVHAWLGAIKAFSPLFYHHDDLCKAVINAMHAIEESHTGGQDQTQPYGR
jgi:hypothetical protein